MTLWNLQPSGQIRLEPITTAKGSNMTSILGMIDQELPIGVSWAKADRQGNSLVSD